MRAPRSIAPSAHELAERYAEFIKYAEVLQNGGVPTQKMDGEITGLLRRMNAARVRETEPYRLSILEVDKFFDRLCNQLATIHVRNSQ